MAINTKDINTIAQKFATNAGAAGNSYKQGIANPRRPWAATTAAAATSWSDGVQTAVQNNRFQKGVTAAGDAKWSQNSSTVGAQRYPSGAQNAQAAYNAGETPYLQVIQNLNLPPRYPRGDTRNNDRVAAVTAALHAKKVSG
jgi:hypothetical protein